MCARRVMSSQSKHKRVMNRPMPVSPIKKTRVYIGRFRGELINVKRTHTRNLHGPIQTCLCPRAKAKKFQCDENSEIVLTLSILSRCYALLLVLTKNLQLISFMKTTKQGLIPLQIGIPVVDGLHHQLITRDPRDYKTN